MAGNEKTLQAQGREMAKLGHEPLSVAHVLSPPPAQSQGPCGGTYIRPQRGHQGSNYTPHYETH